MQEIEVKENSLKVKVFINGTPDLKNIPKEKAERILAALELEIRIGFRGSVEEANEDGDDCKRRCIYETCSENT